jgi:hypothetical protein
LLFLTGAYAVSLFADKFLSTNVDVAIIRMVEGLHQGGRPKQIPTILKGLQEDERLRVLERVLDSRVSSCLRKVNEKVKCGERIHAIF